MIQILLVEDESVLLEALEEELAEEGYDVISAYNGIEALEKLANYAPDLILSDISMPDMNGYDLLENVRENFPKLTETPFVFLTAFSAKEDIIKGKKLGADDYLVKPVDFDLLFATIEARLAQVERMVDLKEQQFLKLYNALQKPFYNTPQEDIEEEDQEKNESYSNKDKDSETSRQDEKSTDKKSADKKAKPSQPTETDESDTRKNDSRKSDASKSDPNKTDPETRDRGKSSPSDNEASIEELLRDDDSLEEDAKEDIDETSQIEQEPLNVQEELEQSVAELPTAPKNPTYQDVLDYIDKNNKIYGIFLHFENIKSLFERARRHSEINLNHLVANGLNKILPKYTYFESEVPGCACLYFAENKIDKNGFDFRPLYYEAQHGIFNSEVSELATTNIANTFTGMHLRVSQIPFAIDVTLDELNAHGHASRFVRQHLSQEYKEKSKLQNIIEYVDENGSLKCANFRARYNRTREVKFFYYDKTSEAFIKSAYAFMTPNLASDWEFELDKSFIKHMARHVMDSSSIAYYAIDVHFDTIAMPEKLMFYKKHFETYLLSARKKYLFNVRGAPRNLTSRQFSDIISRINVPNTRFMLQLNPWTDSLIEVDRFSLPFIVWNFEDIYGFSSKLDHIKKLKLIYKGSQAPLIIRNIPNNCDIMFLKGYGFDAFSFNFDTVIAQNEES